MNYLSAVSDDIVVEESESLLHGTTTQYGTIVNLLPGYCDESRLFEEEMGLLSRVATTEIFDPFPPFEPYEAKFGAKNKYDDEKRMKSTFVHRVNLSRLAYFVAIIAMSCVCLVTVSIMSFLWINSQHKVNFSFLRVDYIALDYFDNDYETPFLSYAILSEHTAVIEPSQKMMLYFYSDDYDGYYKYAICNNVNNECQNGVYLSNEEQEAVQFDCDPFDTFTISLYRFYPFLNGYSQLIASETAICMYVRREYRDLTEGDKSLLLDTMYVMSTTSQEEGQALYGDSFMNSTYISKFHYFNAAQRDADHVHEGNGFLMQHVKFTNWFDSSLRSINSYQSMPYWDFTIDASRGLDSTTIALASADDFGSLLSPVSLTTGYAYDTDKISDGRIVNGRWENLTVNQNTFYEDMKSGYGYLRAPWGQNPSPYISRFAFDYNLSLPSCSDHYDLLQYTDMMDFFVESSFQPHGAVHTVLGGFYGCNKLFELVDSGYIYSRDDAITICSSWDFFMKELYRDGLITPYNDCIVSPVLLEDSRCGFNCKNTLEARENITSFLFPRILENANITMPDARSIWMSFICGGDGGAIFTGDHLESSSAADPSFWVIHGSLERLLHAKMLAGGFESNDWATDPSIDYVCERSTCYNDMLGYKIAADSCCYGHYERDQMLDAVTGDRWSYIGETNYEILSATNASSKSYSMPYIYDKLSWSHCSDASDIDSLLLRLFTDTISLSSSKQEMPKKQKELRKWKAEQVLKHRFEMGLPSLLQ